MTSVERLKLYTSVVPSRVQRSIQRDNFNAFVHYGLNTFANKEWSDGTLSPEIFNPTNQDAEQWVKVLKFAGAKGIIFTAKHHDGFCMWQTATTDYSVKSSPYLDGKGDVVKEVAAACKKHGVKFGIYLSPWDRNCPLYGSAEYDDFYVAQLKELLTGYGEIFAVWLDGACGAASDGKPVQKYDFNRYYEVIRKLQPKAVISNCGPDVRWVGNEGGFARDGEWCVIPEMDYGTQSIIEQSQHEESENMKAPSVEMFGEELGSREMLEKYSEFVWSPAEVDVSIRPGWFYHKSQDHRIRSVNNLLYIYYTAVGGNSLLLLNVPPDATGRLNDADVDRLVRFADRKNAAFSKPVTVDGVTAPLHEEGFKPKNMFRFGFDKNSFESTGYYTPKDEADSYEITLKLAKTCKVDKLRLIENVSFSQRVESFRIEAKVNGKFKTVYYGKTIGFNRIAFFRAVRTDEIKIVIDSCRLKPYIEYVGVFEQDKKGKNPHASPLKSVMKAIHRLHNIRAAKKKAHTASDG